MYTVEFVLFIPEICNPISQLQGGKCISIALENSTSLHGPSEMYRVKGSEETTLKFNVMSVHCAGIFLTSWLS